MQTDYSSDIIIATKWQNANYLIDHLKSLPQTSFTENNLGVKQHFIQTLKRLISSIELEGAAAKETKQMVGPGSILENLSFHQLQIRSVYLRKRKQLKTILKNISVLSAQMNSTAF